MESPENMQFSIRIVSSACSNTRYCWPCFPVVPPWLRSGSRVGGKELLWEWQKHIHLSENADIIATVTVMWSGPDRQSKREGRMHEKGWLRNFQGEQSESVRERRWVSAACCLSVHGRWDEDSGDMFSPPPEQRFVSLKSEGTAQFPSLAPLSPISATVTSSLIELRAISPAVMKPLQACGWPCACVACGNAHVPGSVGMRRWFCVHDRAGVGMRLSNMCARMRERERFAQNQTSSENEKVLVLDGVRVSKEEKGLIHSLPACVWWVSQVLTKKNMYVFKSNTKHPFCLERSCLACLFCCKVLVRRTQETRWEKNPGWHI